MTKAQGHIRPASRPSNRSAGRPSASANTPGSSRLPWIISGLVIVVGLAVLVAIFSTGDDDEPVASSGFETAAVTVTGNALSPAEGSGLIDPATDSAVGETVPTLSGLNPSGAPIAFGPTGKPTVTIFVAHWCPHCQAEVPRLVTWLANGDLPADIDVRLVSTAVRSDSANYPPSAWFIEEGWGRPVLVDSAANQAADAFGLKSFPYWVFTDGDGVVGQRATGELPLEDVLAALATVQA